MGYRAKSVRQRVVFHPLVAPFFKKSTHAFVRQIKRLRPKNSFLSKLDGMLRFYFEGEGHSTEQCWPECLVDRKNELIETSNLRKKK
jgi:hypothetical protein